MIRPISELNVGYTAMSAILNDTLTVSNVVNNLKNKIIRFLNQFMSQSKLSSTYLQCRLLESRLYLFMWKNN